MTYPEQLKTPDWQKRRREIILRDACTCQKCGNERIISGKTYIKMPDVKWTSNHFLINFKFEGEHVRKFLKTEYSIFNDKIDKGEDLLEMYIDKTELGIKMVALRLIQLDFSGQLNKLQERINRSKLKMSSIGGPAAQIKKIFLNKHEKEYQIVSDLHEKSKNYQPYLIVPGLNVHHKKYLPNRMAWDYTDDYLMTVCRDCHEDIHKEDFSFKKSQYDNGFMF